MARLLRSEKGTKLSQAEGDNNVKEAGYLAGDLASASTVDLNTNGNQVRITGTTGITSFDDNAPLGTVRILTFADSLTITHNATSLILPGRASIVTKAGDIAIVRHESGPGNWRCVVYQRADGGAVASRRFNLADNGAMQIAQRAVPNLSTTAQFGKVDRWAVWASTGTVSAGTITDDASTVASSLGASLRVSGATLTGSAVLSFRHRIEARRALLLKNKSASISMIVRHDVGSSINYTVIVRKANSADNFGAVTTISTSSATSAPTGSDTTVLFEAVSMGDCSNGIEIEVQAACGAVTTKNFYLADFQIHEGMVAQPFAPASFDDELGRCEVYFQKSFPYATAPAQNAGTAGVTSWGQVVGATTIMTSPPIRFRRSMRTAPTLTTYNPSAANSDVRNITSGGNQAPTQQYLNDSGFSLRYTTNAATAAGNEHGVHWSADAEL